MIFGLQFTRTKLSILTSSPSRKATVRIPKLRARERSLFERGTDKPIRTIEASVLLCDAKREDGSLVAWPSLGPHRGPCISHSLEREIKLGLPPVYPKRIDVYHHTTQATICNASRLARIQLLAIISRTANLLNQSGFPTLCDDETALSLSEDHQQAENKIREYRDDICSSIPFTIHPTNMRENSTHFPHEPGAANISTDSAPDLTASMSQLRMTLLVGSRVDSVPHSQKQWMQQYLTLLSRSPIADRDKAVRLELAWKIFLDDIQRGSKKFE